jgi:nitrite reductase/ring-hydroxylating ferredoxin subunit
MLRHDRAMSDARYKLICAVEELALGELRRAVIDGYPPIAVYNVGGAFYATSDFCTHGRALLSEGFLDGKIVECPFHGGKFDVTTGKPAEAPCVVPVRTWPLVVRDGQVLLDSMPG